MDNGSIARVFAEMADLCEIRNENVFKIRALRSAAATIEALPFDVEPIAADQERLREIKGIGQGIAKKIQEICETGTCAEHQALLAEFPLTILELLQVEGVGPKKVKLFHDSLGVRTVDELEAAARAGRVRGLPRMSAAGEEKLLKAIAAHKARSGRFLLSWAEAVVERIAGMIREVKGVERVEPAGSFRRRRETVGDLDFLVCASQPDLVMDRFCQAGEVIARGESKCSIKLSSGIQADLRIVPRESFGAALHYFTGSKGHNVAIRTLAVHKRITINEYGAFKMLEDGSTGERVGGEKEEDIFSAVGLHWIPPELREDRGEIEAARDGKLPALLSLEDIRGDVHMHSAESDGSCSVEEMALAALSRGYGYVAITDHSKALAMAHGLDETRLRAHAQAIRKVDSSLQGKIRVFTGIEVDILRDGEMDLAADSLRELDVVIGSVHSHFNLAKEDMTARVIKSIESGLVDIIAHPTGRLLLRRDAFQIDLEKVLRAAKAHGVAMEINAFPDRLDLSDIHCRRARDLGVKLVMSTDSHADSQLELMRFGVGSARRGWLETRDILNTRDAGEFLRLLHEGHR